MDMRGSLLYEPRSLEPLVESSELLRIDTRGKIIAKDKLAPILDENGIPDRIRMLQKAMASVAAGHTWTGKYDLHHMAYEGSTYRQITTSDGIQIGSQYRGSALLKVILPRQLHEYMHLIYETPPVPDMDAMWQYSTESQYVHDLFNTIRVDSYRGLPELQRLPFAKQERLRKESFKRKLEHPPIIEFGIVPDIELLAQLRLRESRRILRALARASGLSDVIQKAD